MDRQQKNFLQWALKGFPEDTVVKENERINQERSALKDRKVELQKRIQEVKDHEIDVEGIEQFCKQARQNLVDFTYDDKRLSLEALQVEVLIDNNTISIRGAIPISLDDIVSTPAGSSIPEISGVSEGIRTLDLQGHNLAP